MKNINISQRMGGVNFPVKTVRINAKVNPFHFLCGKHFQHMGLIWCFCLFLSACGTDLTNIDGSSGPTAFKINVPSQRVYLSEINSQYSIRAIATDDNDVAFIEQPVFSWESDNEAIVSVDDNGVVTAIAMGEAIITVSANDSLQQIIVIVSDEVISLVGNVQYEDREYNASGFTGRSDYYKNVRHAQIQLLDDDGQVLQSTFTDQNGDYELTGVITSQQRLVVIAKTDLTQGLNLAVKDLNGHIYSVASQLAIAAGNTHNIKIPLSSDASGAFNILDVFTNAAEFTKTFTGTSQVNLSAFWEPNNERGTYYCTHQDSIYCIQGAGVYIYSRQNGDSDEYDDDVLYHEFGHYFTANFSRDDSYGGCHLLSSNDLDLRLAWSEGWGDFFPAAVKSWLAEDAQRALLLSIAESESLATYVDTYGTASQISIDLESVSTNRFKTAGNEIANARILWSLKKQFGMQMITDVLSNYLVSVQTPVNLEAFWDGWISSYAPQGGDKAILLSLFSERSVFYTEDQFESDDDWFSVSRKFALGSSETHHLYSETGVDKDLIAFDVQRGLNYVVSTSDLTSGADTFLRILDEAGNTLEVAGITMENDDIDESAYYGYDSSCGSSRVHNNGTALASKVSFSALNTGTYYAEVQTTPEQPAYLSAGRYGTYRINIDQN